MPVRIALPVLVLVLVPRTVPVPTTTHGLVPAWCRGRVHRLPVLTDLPAACGAGPPTPSPDRRRIQRRGRLRDGLRYDHRVL
ncbi:hypothetical protein, partial [Tomitella biformata]|uniref:hypothetical protein n=1 Tax=Tomitella biformata TaxID=630403 RepID=UPI001F233ACB